MSILAHRFSSILFAFCGLLILAEGVQAAEQAATPQNTIDVNLADMEVAEAMQVLSDATGFNIIVSNKVQGKLTAYIVDMEPEQALKQVVEVNGFHYVKNGNVVWVLSDEEFYEDRNMGRARRVIPLLNARADVLAAMLPNALSKNAVVIAYPETNVIVIAELEDRIEEAIHLVEQLDVPPTTRVFQLNHATAADMLLILQSHVASPDALKADQRTNQILITGTPETLDRLGRLLEEFDKPDKVSTRVYPLKYANADVTAELIREILTGRRQSSSEGGFASSSSANQPPPTVFTTEPSRPGSANPNKSWSAYRREGAASTTTPGAAVAAAAAQAPASPAAQSAPVTGATTSASTASAPTAVGDDAVALGPLASVAADSRTNSVIVTHVESVLERIEQIITAIDVPGQYHTYQFQNVDPSELELETKLMSLLPAEDPYLQVDPISSKVTFRAPLDKSQELLALLKEWDQTVRQVRIEAEILRVNATFLRKLGINWQAVKLDNAGIGKANININFPAEIDDNGNQGTFTIGNLESDDYSAVLQALREDNDTEVIATPSILARDRKEALFTSARDEPYTVVTVDGNTQTTLEDVRFLNVGVSLMVAPQIHKDDVITLDTQLEISNLVEIREGIPVVDRATAQSSISVKDHGTVILGGLRQRSRSNLTQGVPVLSRVPMLGGLFRNRRDGKEEREILLILRPVIEGNTQRTVSEIGDVRRNVDSAMEHKELSQGDELLTPSTSRREKKGGIGEKRK